jgi:sugar lactone lactonase YvrE
MPGADPRRPLDRVAGGFSFAEGPRWHHGAIYLSHIHDDAIERVDVDGTVTRVADLPGSPISMGFASDGSILVSALRAGVIWRIADGEISVFRDVSSLADDDFGDIVIDEHDRIYLANQGMQYPSRIPDTIDSPIFLLTPDGESSEVARGFAYANGLAITPDGRTLIVAESFGHRLLALDINDDGSLADRRRIVQFPDEARPDGICCDAEGAVWTANATSREVVRCTLDGSITDRISTGSALAIGCILGGDDGCDLYITTATTALRDEARATRQSALWRTRADVPAGGRP